MSISSDGQTINPRTFVACDGESNDSWGPSINILRSINRPLKAYSFDKRNQHLLIRINSVGQRHFLFFLFRCSFANTKEGRKLHVMCSAKGLYHGKQKDEIGRRTISYFKDKCYYSVLRYKQFARHPCFEISYGKYVFLVLQSLLSNHYVRLR